ncbi:hypothetical protein C9J21_08820 [Photobacterium phosphoreum]|uniref:hypothetical protein n=1 Tax=Photobacterium phosphoreum TaxID=659 RepID=UPI000D16491A|nr:hypothetical protein [Photobacterium phosphoreum]PSW33398.1 hypothetical protein C9J21_08820 [Photobacterium phosphoreum]
MITPLELFDPKFKPSDLDSYLWEPNEQSIPKEIVIKIVKVLIDEIDCNLKRGIVSFECDMDINIPEIKNQDAIHQLICKLVNNEMNKFGWLVYIRMQPETCNIILAVKECDLTSIEILITNELD